MNRLARDKGLSVRGLADRVEANVATVRRWAAGQVEPSPRHIKLLADVLGCEPDRLYVVPEAKRCLGYHRIIAGYSIAQLAPELGISSVHLGRLERGVSPLSECYRERLRELLGLDEPNMRLAEKRAKLRDSQREG